MDHLCYLWFVFVMLLRLFFAALWSPEGKMPTSWLLFVMFIVIVSLSNMVLDCIDSWSLLSFLLSITILYKCVQPFSLCQTWGELLWKVMH